MRRPMLVAVLIALGLGAAAPVSAEVLIENPAAWRLEDYGGGNVVIWFTGARPVCTNGRLALGATMGADERNRLWSTVLSAKLSGRQVGLSYTGSGDNCVVASFFIE